MVFNHATSLIFLSILFVFSSCKKSDSGPRNTTMTITSISPTSGPSATLDTLVGTNFSAKDSVYFNGKGASIVSASATQLVVKVPPQAGTGKVTITNDIGSATGPVFTFTGNTYLVSTFAGSGNIGLADGTGTAASFNTPLSIGIDSHDNLFVADYLNHMVRKITPGGVVTTFAGSSTQGSANGTGAAASFKFPYGIAVDSSNDNVYVADLTDNKIRQITSAGLVSTFAGSGIAGSTDATGTAASFHTPTAVAVDGSGNVFVADYVNRKIRKISPAGVVTSLAGNGNMGSSDGQGTAASFKGIQGIRCDATGNLYAADGGNNTIRKITPDGIVTTIAGSVGVAGYADGTGNSALFNSPNDVAIDGNGFIYVVDATNNLIRQINPEGAVTLLAGIFGSFGTDDGPAAKARFNNPAGIAIDSHGNLFVTDANNNTIRKLTPQ